jgi:hypothetical protein
VIRTQVTLDENDYTLAKSEAKALGISVAEFVRRSIRQCLPSVGQKPWMKFIGMVETGDPHSSQSVDDMVYGRKD